MKEMILGSEYFIAPKRITIQRPIGLSVPIRLSDEKRLAEIREEIKTLIASK